MNLGLRIAAGGLDPNNLFARRVCDAVVNYDRGDLFEMIKRISRVDINVLQLAIRNIIYVIDFF